MQRGGRGRGGGRAGAASMQQVDLQGYVQEINTRFGELEQQLHAITKQLTDLGATRAPTNPSEEDSGGSDDSSFHRRRRRDDHRRPRRRENRGDLNLKIEILEYHSSLRGDDFIKQIFDTRVIPDDHKVKIAAMRQRRQALAWWEQT